MHKRIFVYFLVAVLVLVTPLNLVSAQSFVPEVFAVDQPAVDGMVRVTRLTINDPGFVVIHADDNGQPGPDIGAVRVEPGIIANVHVPIDADAATETLYAMLHTDGGQVGVYEGPGEPDAPIVDASGTVVMVAFQVTSFESTIVATAVETGNFETLITALTAAGLVETLQGEGPFTVFAPTDEAFATLPEGALDELLTDTETLTSILNYHVVAGKLLASDLTDGMELETLQGTMLTVSLTDGAQVNDANITVADVEAFNGVIHVIDTVLLPPVEEEATPAPTEEPAAEEAEATPTPTEEAAEEAAAEATPEPTEEAAEEAAEATPEPTEEAAEEAAAEATPTPTEAPAAEAAEAGMVDEDIVEIAVSADDFNTLVAALTAADLVDALQGDGPFTLFAPTDDAFAALPEGTLDALLADPASLSSVLLYHVVPGAVLAADVTDGLEATTLQGDTVSFTVSNGTVMVNDANIIVTDIVASNGVIHVIDAVILPPADETMEESEETESEEASGEESSEMAGPTGLPTTGGSFGDSTSALTVVGLLLAVLGGVSVVQRRRSRA